MKRLVLLMHCPDKKGIIASVTNFVHQQNGNIVYIDQYVDRIQSTFFMRIEVEGNYNLSNFELFKTNFENEHSSIFQISCSFYLADILPKMAVFVSKYDHCLYDILAQQRSGKLSCTIPFIISNHMDLEPIAKQFGIPFYYIPITKNSKEKAEQKQLILLKKYEVDCIVLARYMQILSSRIIDVYPSKIINIHHSFLPAFPGAKPYHSAFQRGVKIIGATSHYVTEELDGGKIIAQERILISPSDTPETLSRKVLEREHIIYPKTIESLLS